MTTFTGPPLRGPLGAAPLTLCGFLKEVAVRFAGNEALVFDDPLADGVTSRWSYEELYAKACSVARALVEAGTGLGGRVGILMGSRPEAVAAVFGAAMAGAVAVPLSTFSTREELDYLLRHSCVEVVLTQTLLRRRRFVEDLLALCPSLPSPTFPFLRGGAAVGLSDAAGWIEPWERWSRRGCGALDTVRARLAEVSPCDPGLLMYSSGTTARPKGILHSHRAPVLQFRMNADLFGRHQRTRLWTALPLFWTAGFNTAMGATLAAGGCWVMQEAFDAAEALALIEREKVTEPYCLPHQTQALAEQAGWQDADLSSLRCVYGKSALARHPSVKGDPDWNMPVAYGMSETCSTFAAHSCRAGRETMRRSMGPLLPGNRLRVLDPGTGRPLGPGEEGELAVAGPTLMERYLRQTRDECFDEDGFFHTGDWGYMDEKGELHWTGRRSEVIKTAGANVSPAELEVALRAFPQLKLARVLGMPDERLGQAVVLCAVLKEGASTTAEEVLAFLRSRVASYKVPRHVLFFASGEVPMTAGGTKVQDAALRRLVAERLSLEA